MSEPQKNETQQHNQLTLPPGSQIVINIPVQQQQKKPKLSQRLARASFNGMSAGFVGFIVTYFFSTSTNMLGNQNIFNAIALGLFSFAFLMAASIGIELSKDLES